VSDDSYDPDDYDRDGIEDEGSLDSADTLEGAPGNDPLDQGSIAPDRWSAGMRYGSTAAEEKAGESLDQLLAEEEPDVTTDDAEDDDAWPAQVAGDVDAADEDVDGLLLDDGPDPRAGRLVAEDEGAHSRDEADLVARDVGVDAGAASAEEAAVHEVADDDTDIRSGE
jgi:hypothetical protein